MPPAQHITVVILGCGSSGGVSRIGNQWGVCNPANPRNRRRRCSLLITGRTEGMPGATSVLIDTGADLREQLLDAEVPALDAVFYTHEHADHTHGIDDLRVLAINSRRRVDVYCSRATEQRLRASFGYCFSSPPNSPYPPILNANNIEDGEEVVITGEGGSIAVRAFQQEHGDITSLGFRVGNFAYSCDLSGIPDTSLQSVSGLDVWILDALRPHPHPSHLSLPEALQWIERMAPRQAVLTNLHIDMDYDEVDARTPANVRPAYDGLRVDVTAGKVLS